MEINDTYTINLILNLDDKYLEILLGFEYLKKYNYNLYQLLIIKNYIINKLSNYLYFDITEYNIDIFLNNTIDNLLKNFL